MIINDDDVKSPPAAPPTETKPDSAGIPLKSSSITIVIGDNEITDKKKKTFEKKSQSFPIVNAGTSASKDPNRKRELTRLDSIFLHLREPEIDGYKALIKSTTRYGKLFWTIILVACFGILSYETVTVFINYYTRPISTSYNIRSNRTLRFPNITICPLDGVNWTKVDGDESMINYILYMKETSGMINYHGQINVLEESTRLDTNKTLTEVYEKFMDLGYDASQFMPICSFYQGMASQFPCSEIVQPRLESEYGKCYSLSLGADRVQTVPGQALQIVFNLQKNIRDQLLDVPILASRSNGIKLEVDGGTQVLLRPGSDYKIHIQTEKISLINVFRGEVRQSCVDGEITTFEYKIFHEDNYKQASCMADCHVRRIWSTCQCLPLLDPTLVKSEILINDNGVPAKICDLPKYRDCIHPMVDNNSNNAAELQACRDKCYPPCDYFRYELKVSDAPLSKLYYRHFLERYNTTIDNFISVDLSYPTLDYPEFKQDFSKSFDELVSDVGGQIGLWVGASMVTLIQIPFALTMMCLFTSCKKAKTIHRKVIDTARSINTPP